MSIYATAVQNNTKGASLLSYKSSISAITADHLKIGEAEVRNKTLHSLTFLNLFV